MKNANLVAFAPPDVQSGRKVAETPEGTKQRTGLKKWRDKVIASTAAYRGTSGDGEAYVIRMQVAGRRCYTDLGTSDLAEAAKKARTFHFDVQSVGWDKAVAKLQPAAQKMAAPVDKLTIGEYLKAVREVWTAREITYWECCSKLRRLVSLVLGLKADPKDKWRGPKGEETPWQRKINELPLSSISPAAVATTMEAYVKARSKDSESELAAKHTVSSLVRNARSLFSRRIIVPRLKIELPERLPFDGVKLFRERMGDFRFRREVDVNALIQAAHHELSQESPRLYVIFLLALGAGLRRNEIDKLRWREVVHVAGEVEVAKTDVFEPKSYSSLRKVKLPPQFYRAILEFRKDASLDAFVLPSERPASLNTRTRKYRCKSDFDALNAWLETKGIRPRDRKKIQTLRKHFGDVICSTYGIYKAAAALGHQKVSTTEKFYAAPPEVEAAPLELPA